MLGEAGRVHQLGDRPLPERRKDLRREDGWILTLTLPLAHGTLMVRILPCTGLAGLAPVRWISLF